MLDLKLITENPELVKARLAKKGCVADFTEVLKLDAERKELMAKIEALKAERNKVSAEIPKLKKEGKPVEEIFARMRKIGEEIAEGDAKIDDLQKRVCVYGVKMYNPARRIDKNRDRCFYRLFRFGGDIQFVLA